MDINKIFTDYGYDKTNLLDLPPDVQGYVEALKHVVNQTIPNVQEQFNKRAHQSTFCKIEAECANTILKELIAYINVDMKEIIISTVDGMNVNANRSGNSL